MNQYRDLEQQIKAYADGQTPDLFDRLSEWEDRAQAPIVLPLPRKSHALRAVSLAACFVLLCGGLFVYLNRPKTDGLIAAPQQSALTAGQAEDERAEDDAVEIVEDCADEDILEDDWDEAVDNDEALIEDGADAELESAAPALPEEPAVQSEENGLPEEEGDSLLDEALIEPESAPEPEEAPSAQTGGAKLRSPSEYGQEAAASSAEPGEGSAEMDPGDSFRPKKAEEDADAVEEEDDAAPQLPSGGSADGAVSGNAAQGQAAQTEQAASKSSAPAIDEPAVALAAAPDAEADGKADSGAEETDNSTPDAGTAAAQEKGAAASSAGEAAQAADSLPEGAPAQGGEQLVRETNILRNFEMVMPSQFAAQMAAPEEEAPQAAEGEPAAPELAQAPPESGLPAGELPDGEAAPESQPKPDPAKELEAVLLETGVTKLAPAWLPEGFVLEKAYVVSGDEPEDVKTGVAVYGLPPAPEETAKKEAAEDSAESDAPAADSDAGKPTAEQEQETPPKEADKTPPPLPSLTISVKAREKEITLPAGEEWTVLFHDQRALVKHEIQAEGDTVLRNEFTAVFTRNGYLYVVKGTAMEQEDFYLAIQSIFWKQPEA